MLHVSIISHLQLWRELKTLTSFRPAYYVGCKAKTSSAAITKREPLSLTASPFKVLVAKDFPQALTEILASPLDLFGLMSSTLQLRIAGNLSRRRPFMRRSTRLLFCMINQAEASLRENVWRSKCLIASKANLSLVNTFKAKSKGYEEMFL